MDRLSDEAKRVVTVFEDLLSNNNQKIKAAEEILYVIGQNKGYVGYLIEIANASDPPKPEAIRKSAAAILLANVKEYYIDTHGHGQPQPSMHEDDRQFLRMCMLDSVVTNLDLSAVYETYMEVLTIMIQVDHPHRWKGLLEGLVGKLLNPRNIEELVGGLLASNCLIKAYERSLEGSQRHTLEEILKYLFPLLEKLLTVYMNELYSTQTDDLTKEKALRIIIECINGLSMAVRMKVPSYFICNKDKFSMWMVVVKGLLDRPINAPCLVQRPEVWQETITREDHPEWRVRTLCMKVVFRLSIHMAGEPINNQEEEFWGEFNLRYSKGFFETCYRFIEMQLYGDIKKDPRPVREMQEANGEFVAPKVLSLSLRSLVNLLELDSVFEVAKVHLERILLDYLIPLMQVNVRDKELWLEDQVQLVYSEKTPSDDHNMVKNACIDAISSIADLEVEGELLIFRLMNFAACCLEQRRNPRTGFEMNIRQREALLRVIQGLADSILEHKRIADRLDAFFAKCVISELNNQNRDEAFLRMRALFVYSKLGMVCRFADRQLNIEIIQGISSGLAKSKDKAVQIAAAEALTVLLSQNDIKQMLLTDFNLILGHLLNLMKEVELDDLVDALEQIVAHFSDSIGGDSVIEVIEELKAIYFQYRPNPSLGNNISDDNVDEVLRAADSCLDTINSLIRTCPQQFPMDRLTEIVFELLNDTLMRTNDEICFEKCVNLLNLIIYKCQKLTNQNTIAYFPLLCYLIIGRPQSSRQLPDGLPEVFSTVGMKKEWVHDLRCLVGCFLNYMNKMGTNFLESRDLYENTFVQLIFEVIKKIGQECIDRRDASNLTYGLRIIMGMLENFPTQATQFFPTILGIILELRHTPLKDDVNMKNMMFQLMSVMFWCNAEALIEMLADQNVLGASIKALLDQLNHYNSETQFEVALLGLGRFFTLNPRLMQTTETTTDGISMSEVMKYCIELCKRILVYRNSDPRGVEAIEDKDAQCKRSDFYSQHNQSQHNEADDDSDFDSEADDDELNAFNYDSPLDSICPILELKNILEEIKLNPKHRETREFLGSRLTSDQFASLEIHFSDAHKHKIT